MANNRNRSDRRCCAVFVLLAVAQTITQKALRTSWVCAESWAQYENIQCANL